ncbi:MAG TPA: tetratricopeptide repeat protein [Mucilaginibacter sp.]
MKSILLFILFICSFLIVSAQESHKIDDGLLMEYLQGQRYNEAADYLKKSFPEPVSDVKVLTRLAYISQLANRLPDAEAYYQRAYNIDTTSTGILFSMAGINLRRGNNTRAEKYYLQIIARDTTNAAVYTHLGSIAEGRNDTLNAINYYDKANRLQPNDADIASQLGDYYTSLKQYDDALRVLNKAAESDPENVTIQFSMMKLAYSQKKWKETVDACYKLMQNGLINGQIYNKLGIAYFNLKDYACGAETFASLKGIEQTEYTFYYTALCYKGLKDDEKAIYFLNQALFQAISPNVATYYGEIADSDIKLNRNKKAVFAYQKALQFAESPTLYYLLADLYDKKLKDKKNALLYYKKYLAAKLSTKQQTYVAYIKSRVAELKN